MNAPLTTISLAECDARQASRGTTSGPQSVYGGPLSRHVAAGDSRLLHVRFDGSTAALRLWNFLLTEEQRLRAARARGMKIVGVMKDLGTVPVMAYALPNMLAFYPDGAWWIPCIMERHQSCIATADALGIDESFCPVRAMLGAFVSGAHFPRPDVLTCSVGATCDDFSAIAQRLEGLGIPITWWEMPYHRLPEQGEAALPLPGGGCAPRALVDFVAAELERVKLCLEEVAGAALDEAALSAGIRRANAVRRVLAHLRRQIFSAHLNPLPALELLIAEMLAIHFCSDIEESRAVLEDLLREVEQRVQAGDGYGSADAVRVFWVNPVADLRAMSLLEDAGARVCGTDNMFLHALDEIAEDLPPMQALACAALADPMTGPAARRGARICRDSRAAFADAVIIARIPGASHCATEGTEIAGMVRAELGIPVTEIEVPSVCDADLPALRTRVEATIEAAREHRRQRECGVRNAERGVGQAASLS